MFKPSLTAVVPNVTLQVPEARVQLVALNVPVLFDVKLTLPVGVIPPAPEASLTVTVHVHGVLSRTLAGEQVTLVVDARRVEASVKVPLLPVWTLSPAYVPVIKE